AEDGIRDFHVTGVQTCALPISEAVGERGDGVGVAAVVQEEQVEVAARGELAASVAADGDQGDAPGVLGARREQPGEPGVGQVRQGGAAVRPDRKSTRLNSSHVKISYAVLCL